MTEPTPVTLLESQLKDMKDAGLPVHKGVRTFKDNKQLFSKANARALEIWLPTWVKNAAENYCYIKDQESLSWLRGSAVGLPVVVVGIGPSLDQDIAVLKTVAAKNALIIATDAALRPLLADGIVPHVVITYDCKAEQFTLFEGLKEQTKNVVLLANSCTHPNTLRHWAGPLLFFNMQHPGVDFMDVTLPCMFPTFGPMSNHGTVGNAGILLAYAMGANPILLLGMDLCYQKDGEGFRYRCTDYSPERRDDRTGMPASWKPKVNKVLYDNDERLATAYDVKLKDREFKVDEALEFYRKGAVELIGTMGNVRVVDCSTGGILDACGVEHMAFQDAVNEFCAAPIEKGQTILPHLSRLLPRIAFDDAPGA